MSSVAVVEASTTTTRNAVVASAAGGGTMLAETTSLLVQDSSSSSNQRSAHLLELSTATYYNSYDALLQTILQLSFGSSSDSGETTKCHGTSCSSSTTPNHRNHNAKPTTSRRKKRCRTDDAERTTQTDASCSAQKQLQQQLVAAAVDENRKLPHELAIRVADYLVIYPVDMKYVVATSCSSQRMQSDGITPIMPLSECLIESDTSWWISSEGLNIRPQYVEFDLVGAAAATDISACRVTSVSIQIPPLPQGPMSVRTFQLMSYTGVVPSSTTPPRTLPHMTIEYDTTNELWHWRMISETPYCTVLNRIGWQTYVLPTPVDASRIRIVCLTNQIFAIGGSVIASTTRQQPTALSQEQVGFYCIKFE